MLNIEMRQVGLQMKAHIPGRKKSLIPLAPARPKQGWDKKAQDAGLGDEMTLM